MAREKAARFEFGGRTAIVTGAGQGIGKEIARELAEAHATVVIADLNADQAEATAQEFRDAGSDAIAFGVDITVESEVAELMEFAARRQGIDILVNCAGISTTRIIAETDVDSWRRVLEVNLTGPFITCRAVLPYMRANGGGKIVNIASIAAKRISANAAASYTASKSGLVGFTRHLAYEAAADGINANVVCPGPVLSPMLERTATPETIAAREASVPSLRISRPEDQARAVLFLCSDAADMINGVAVDVDGGALLGWYDPQSYFEKRDAHELPLRLRERLDPHAHDQKD